MVRVQLPFYLPTWGLLRASEGEAQGGVTDSGFDLSGEAQNDPPFQQRRRYCPNLRERLTYKPLIWKENC